MNVGLDLLFLVPGRTGGRETYARELSGALRGADPSLRLITFVNRETIGHGWWTAHADAVVRVPVTASSRPSWARGELLALPRAAARAGVEVLHSPANFAPWTGPFARVLTLHDLLYRRHPELHSRAARWGTGALILPAARRAHRLISGAEAAATEIRAELGIEDVDVVPHGIAAPRAGDAEAARRRLAAGVRPIVLSVATNVPHKRLRDVLEAVARMPAPRPLLVLAGADTGELMSAATALEIADDVRALGAVDQVELEDLYAAAGALVTLTAHEGFGLPVLEAMARGVPVVCTDLPVLREVGGAQAVYVAGPGEAAVALAAVLASPPDAAPLRERAGRYTWAATARGTLAVYERALAARSTIRKTRFA